MHASSQGNSPLVQALASFSGSLGLSKGRAGASDALQDFVNDALWCRHRWSLLQAPAVQACAAVFPEANGVAAACERPATEPWRQAGNGDHGEAVLQREV